MLNIVCMCGSRDMVKDGKRGIRRLIQWPRKRKWLYQNGSSVGGEKWLNSGYIFEIRATIFAGRLDMGCEKKKEVSSEPHGFVLCNWKKIEFLLTKMGKSLGGPSIRRLKGVSWVEMYKRHSNRTIKKAVEYSVWEKDGQKIWILVSSAYGWYLKP